ncbi:undecaprenyl-diphosphate phosphatase [Granulicella sp. L46]|jgi:undecaprenyl-diphosphatase|uniref:undecaprenyl-diphosphate phosphatase n=1 Tax=Granulicella sp. L46 TaxID=1641865 RepID=UPI00131D9CA7|nr:undecaprenyl-diphosphate phosphatase [Granulicella sp. L46]
MPSLVKILILAVVQGLAELLPVSSSAHVVVAEKLMGLDPSSPQMTLVLVMLHTGTMFAVIFYFWSQWKQAYFTTAHAMKRFLVRAAWATVLTGVVGYPIIAIIERTAFKGHSKGEIEMLFSRLDLIAPALLAAGVLILIAGLRERGEAKSATARPEYERSIVLSGDNVTFAQAGWMGAIQGLCLPFRGFSRSGATISTGLLAGANRQRAERFSFALAVILTPLAIAREAERLLKAKHVADLAGQSLDLHGSVVAALLGMVLSFFAGLAALRWLSSWLEHGRWYMFGVYCLVAGCVVFYLYHLGY